MKSKTPIEQRIRGWLPREPNLPVFQVKPKQKILTKPRILWFSVAATLAMFVGGMIYFSFAYSPNWVHGLDSLVADAEKATQSFTTALNNYDDEAAWNLMSPALLATYGTEQNFNGTVVAELRQVGWHAQFLGVTSVIGDFTFPGSIVKSRGQIQARVIVSQNAVSVEETFSFIVVKPDEWRIDSWAPELAS